MKYFNKALVRIALNGNTAELWSAFAWDDTKQGHTHWNDIATGRKKLSKRSRQYLNKLLNS